MFVSRACQDGRGTVGGKISANEHILSGHETALDGYDVVFEIHVKQGDRNSQFAEAEKIFKESVGALGSPALLVRNLDLLSAAWSPARGLTRFPEGTTPDEEHETLWRPVVAAIERGQKH
ncbi:hypothetical protein AB0I61_29010 [Polymorphospora rubra]|uniref:hypothetical protein n=1 Tax=Polymorphospora rubra TaxID=338584 RepID=UPI00340BB8D8